MDFMKVFDQTVREIKREVNLKVLKVPEIEQKVLDATDDEPWGPHGTVLAEIAKATNKFTECQMIMNVLWTRLVEVGKNWRLVYKALSVIEYLVAHGSERAVDDIIEHTFQISSLTSFEYVEPSGKDVGLNVRKKAETIVDLLNDKEKIQAVRNKAATNRDKYFGLSSTGVTYKSGSASFSNSSSSFQSSDRYGGFSGSRYDDGFKDSYKDQSSYGEEKTEKDTYGKSRRGIKNDDKDGTKKNGTTHFGSVSRSSSKLNDSDKRKSVPSQQSSALSSNFDDFDDDFDPRGTSSTKLTAGTTSQVDLFGDSLIGNLMDAPASVSTEASVTNGKSSDVDVFADADFVSAPSQNEKSASSQCQTQVDFFASEPVIASTTPSAVPSTVDFFSTTDPVVQSETKTSKPDPVNTNVIDPFAAVPLNNFDGSDIFGAFTSSSNLASTEPKQSSTNDASLNNLDGKSLADSKPAPKKDTFQVKSGIWADSLTRGLIDLNISAPKKVSLVDVGVVGGLSDGQDDREKGPPTSLYMGRAMGTGSGLGISGFTSSQPQATGGDDFFSNLGGQQYQFGSFKK